MKHLVRGFAILLVASAFVGCTPEWARQNSSPYILEIAGISGESGAGSPVISDVGLPVTNDDVAVTLNIFRKNNNETLSTSPAERVYLERYEVRYFRTDGRNQEGVDVPYLITSPLGNVRFFTAGPGESTEVTATITLVRHQAKLEPPLRNLQLDPESPLNGNGTGSSGTNLPGAGVLTTVAEITIHGRTVQGQALEATGRVQITFADFP